LVQHVAAYLTEVGPIEVRRPTLATSVSSISFVGLTAGEKAGQQFAIRNAGNEVLEIAAIEAPSSEFSFDLGTPVSVQPGDSVIARVFFEPRGATDFSGSLRIRSNDPGGPMASVEVIANAVDLAFSTRPVLENPTPPLGEPLKIMAIPDAEVRIARGAVFYRSAGAFADVPFARAEMGRFLGTSLLGTIPGEAVTEAGVAYYVQVANGTVIHRDPCRNRDACRDSTSLPDTVFVQTVQPATWVSTSPLALPGTKFFPGRELQIQLSWPRGTQYVDGTLHYRRSGELEYQEDPFDSLSTPGAVIPGPFVTARGVEYWADVRTWGGTLTDPAASPQTSPRAIRTTVRDLRETLVHPAERYRLLSVPLDFGTEPAGDLRSMLADEEGFGAYDPTRWRVFRYLPGAGDVRGDGGNGGTGGTIETTGIGISVSTGGNVEITSGERSHFLPRPGRGFWLISRPAHQIGTAPLEGLSTIAGAPFSIALEPGWNQIGNPFAFPVARESITLPADADSLTAFDPSLGERGGYQEGPVRILEPFEGYFVYNSSAYPETLRVAPVEATPAQIDAALRAAKAGDPRLANSDAPSSSEAWALRLCVRTDHAEDASNIVGIHLDAADERDRLDRREPPVPPGDWVQLAIADLSWDRYAGRYSHDWRAAGAEGHAWDIEIRSVGSAEMVSLDPMSLLDPPAGMVLRLVDVELGTALDLQIPVGRPEVGTLQLNPPGDGTRETYPLLSYGPDRPYRLRLLAGTPAYVNAEATRLLAVPSDVVLQPNSPNPFNGVTRIRFGVPATSEVTVEVFDVRGARVVTLAEGQMYAPGYHTVIWDGRKDGGGLVASGVYFCRISAGGARLTRRLDRVK
jgi:hypothetical protein